MRRVPLAVMAVAALTGCTTIEPGWVGIKVNMYGTNRGVQDLPLVVGRVFYNPVSENVYKYPTFVRTKKWTATADEGSSRNESFSFSSMEGSGLNVDAALSYSFVAQKVPEIFIKYRQDPDHIADNILRNAARDAINKYASTLRAIDLVGSAKEVLKDSVEKHLRDVLEPQGIHVESFAFLSQVRPIDPKVTEAINQTITASQAAIAAENKVRQAKAEADQQVATATGEAEAIRVRAEAQAKANRILAQSLTPELVEWNKIQKWNGQLPQVTGGMTPILNLQK